MQMKPVGEAAPIRSMADERLDYRRRTPLRKSYLIASSYRSGSTYLSWLLWKSGRLGAPSEVLNPTSELVLLMNRFRTSSPADYFAKLLELRTGANGVFGMKAHFHHFEGFLKQYPPLLEQLAPMTFIFISRLDKVAQAVSMAKALLTNKWTSRTEEGPKPVLQYDHDLIARSLIDIEQQDLTWRRWFETQGVTPFEVTYNEITADAAGVVNRIVELLGVQNDPVEEALVPPGEKQGDETNQEWIARFESETRAAASRAADTSGGDSAARQADGAPAPRKPDLPKDAHFCDRYAELAKAVPAGAASATGFFDLIRLRRRYDAIVARSRPLFANARVLDITSGAGFWSLAALDAGAAHVVGADSSPAAVEAANKTFEGYEIDRGSYRFVNEETFAALRSFEPGAFDLILCQGSFEQHEPREFFYHMSRLRPKQVIIDTGIVTGEGPIARFAIGLGGVLGAPNH